MSRSSANSETHKKSYIILLLFLNIRTSLDIQTICVKLKLMKIIFKHAKSLEHFLTFYVHNAPNIHESWKTWEVPDKEHLERRITVYKELWATYESKVINGIEEALGLKFERDIDVYLVAGINRNFSDPLVLSLHKAPQIGMVSLCHELTHRIFSGTSFSFDKILLNKTDNSVVNNHILVYAVIRRIFKDEPEMIKIASEVNDPDYKKAFELSENYEEILKYFRDNK